jgi:DNA-binding transcriptional MerR regulator
MLKIGEFSKLCRVTVKTLRYYDEIDLLKPDLISRENGYRFYRPEKLAAVSEIQSLKDMGFSLEEISRIMKDRLIPGQLITLLSEKQKLLEESIRSEQNSITRIETWKKELKKELKMEKVTIKKLPDIIAATYRRVIPDYNYLFTMAPEMGKKMNKHGAVCSEPAYCFNIYHDGEYKEKDIDVEICEAVVKKLPDADGLVYKKIEGSEKAACIYHRGPYEKLGNSYAVIMKWIESNKHDIAGNPRESFIDGIWNKEDTADWLTEIQIPLK